MNIKFVPDNDMKSQLFDIVGGRNIVYIVCEENYADKLKRRRKLSDISKRRIKMIVCENNGKTYPSIQDAAIELILDPGAISKCLAGKQESTKGYTFRKE